MSRSWERHTFRRKRTKDKRPLLQSAGASAQCCTRTTWRLYSSMYVDLYLVFLRGVDSHRMEHIGRQWLSGGNHSRLQGRSAYPDSLLKLDAMRDYWRCVASLSFHPINDLIILQRLPNTTLCNRLRQLPLKRTSTHLDLDHNGQGDTTIGRPVQLLTE